MNNCAFLQLIASSFKMGVENPIKIYYNKSDGKVILNINGQTWSGDTLDQCINKAKETFSVLYLEQIEFKNNG